MTRPVDASEPERGLELSEDDRRELTRRLVEERFGTPDRRETLLAGLRPLADELPPNLAPVDYVPTLVDRVVARPRLEGKDETPIETLLQNAAASATSPENRVWFRNLVERRRGDRFTVWLGHVARVASTPLPPVLAPYPLLRHHTDRRLYYGREAELESVQELLLTSPHWLFAVYAPSGYGKSSFFEAGLVPRLNDVGVAVAYVRAPARPDLVEQIFRSVLGGSGRGESVPRASVVEAVPRVLARAFDLSAGRGVLLILDQLEDLFKAGSGPAKAEVRDLLRALHRDAPTGAPQLAIPRVLLGYREEYHGEVSRWLRDDVTEGDRIPLGQEQVMPLAPFGAGRAGDAAFLRAIVKPLAFDPKGRSFAPGDAERLALSFSRLRASETGAQDPLVPTLQVVLQKLVREAAGGAALRVPEPAEALLADALAAHVRDALDAVARAVGGETPVVRTRALLTLARLTDGTGKRAAGGLHPDELHAGLDPRAVAVLEGPEYRLLYTQGEDGEARVHLTHDAVAQEVDALLNGADPRRFLEAHVIDLERFVASRAREWARRKDAALIQLDGKTVQSIGEHAKVLLHDEGRREWYAATEAALRAREAADEAISNARDAAARALEETARARVLVRRGLILFALALVAGLVVAAQAIRKAEGRRQGLEKLAAAKNSPSEVLQHAQSLLELGLSTEELRTQLEALPPNVRVQAAAGAPDRDVEAARRIVLESVLPSVEAAEDFGRLAMGLDVALHPETPGGAAARAATLATRKQLREALLERFGRSPPELEYVSVEGGEGWMGSPEGEPGRDPDERLHRVKVDTFRLGKTEVTKADFQALKSKMNEDCVKSSGLAGFDTNNPQVLRPALCVNLFEARAFALWVAEDARLPSEAEWEFAARGGRGQPTNPVAWWTGPEESDVEGGGWVNGLEGGGVPHGACTAEKAHPLGFCDLIGNAWEWTADAYDEAYPMVEVSTAPRAGLPKLRADPQSLRVLRGGSFMDPAVGARSADRIRYSPGDRYASIGFRVARPPPELGP